MIPSETPEKALASGKTLFCLPKANASSPDAPVGKGLEQKHLGGAPAHP